jgi:hypothetical protein
VKGRSGGHPWTSRIATELQKCLDTLIPLTHRCPLPCPGHKTCSDVSRERGPILRLEWLTFKWRAPIRQTNRPQLRFRRGDKPCGGWEGLSTRKSVAQNEQRHDLVGEKRSDDLSGQPCRQRLLSELLDKVARKKKQQLLSDQQDGERCRQHTHAQLLAFRIADNRLTEIATWDDRLLAGTAQGPLVAWARFQPPGHRGLTWPRSICGSYPLKTRRKTTTPSMRCPGLRRVRRLASSGIYAGLVAIVGNTTVRSIPRPSQCRWARNAPQSSSPTRPTTCRTTDMRVAPARSTIEMGKSRGSVAWIAVEDPNHLWPNLPWKNASAGPLYLVWQYAERS